MPAFGTKRTNNITNAIAMMLHRTLVHHPMELDKKQIYRLLVRKRHLDKLEEVHDICGSLANYSYLHVNYLFMDRPIVVTIQFNGDPLDRPLPRQSTIDGFHDENEPEAFAYVSNWFKRRYDIGVAFGTLQAVFNTLNGDMASPQQLAFYLEGISTLLEQDPNNKEDMVMAARLREAPLPAKLPSVHPALRTAARDATKLIARTMLFPHEVPPSRSVFFAFGHGSLGHVVPEWSPKNRITVL